MSAIIPSGPESTGNIASDDSGADAVKQAHRFRNSMLESTDGSVTPIDFVSKESWDGWMSEQDAPTQAWLKTLGLDVFSGKSDVTTIPYFSGESIGSVAKVVVQLSSSTSHLWTAAKIPNTVPKGQVYKVERLDSLSSTDFELGWALGCYKFTRYKTNSTNGKDSNEPKKVAHLLRSADENEKYLVDSLASSTFLVRDIINTPTEDFGPGSLESACRAIAEKYKATCNVITGDDLLDKKYPQVHRVGRAAAKGREPRVIEVIWNESASRTVTLVGKGVCYDTGGLSIKPTSGMSVMKKDLGGAAQVLGLFALLAENKIDARVRLLIPAVENAIAGCAYRPGDILTARNGKTTLNMNSDAEGRLILADCLVAASEENPELIIDCATLTGARTVALGTDIPCFFCTDDKVANEVLEKSRVKDDMMWRLPLHEPYRKMIESNIADVRSTGDGGAAGTIVAALYLKEFVGDVPWIHIDFAAWNSSSRPGRPEGGDALGMRALFYYLQERY